MLLLSNPAVKRQATHPGRSAADRCERRELAGAEPGVRSPASRSGNTPRIPATRPGRDGAALKISGETPHQRRDAAGRGQRGEGAGAAAEELTLARL
jgi:hypothetical protein